ncbi:hypothetical protein [Acidiphilium iwatense]|nr:hypothetical protein [Acidiphilium iwatense]
MLTSPLMRWFFLKAAGSIARRRTWRKENQHDVLFLEQSVTPV